jgi:hypothetical protein
MRCLPVRVRSRVMNLRVILLVFVSSWLASAQTVRSFAQTVTSFEGIDASQIASQLDVDPNGAVGTKQYLEWTNVSFQAYDKVTHVSVWSKPQTYKLLFENQGNSNCLYVGGDGIVMFDHLALRWVFALRSSAPGPNYYYCIAISNTDDLTSVSLSWCTYQFYLNPVLGVNAEGKVNFPDWPKFGTWWNAYYATFDLNDVNKGFREIGVLVCALDRTNMLTGGTPNPMQCFSDPNPIPTSGSIYLKHSLIPADVEGTTAPPSGRDEILVSIQNPPVDKVSTTSNTINLWDFHLDWVTPSNSSLTNFPVSVPTYTPGCYRPNDVTYTTCVPEPSSSTTKVTVDSVGDRLMHRFAYRNFGSYESFLVSHAIKTGAKSQQTGIRWYEFRGSGVPALYQSGTVNPSSNVFRFMPSIAQDQTGNAAVGYNISGGGTHPGIRASWWSLNSQSSPTELVILKGVADEENSWHWGDYSSMTVDPSDDCTFWYVTQYFAQNQTGNQINWNTRIANFKLPSCL